MLMLILCLGLFLGGCEEVENTNIEDTNPTVVDVGTIGNEKAMSREVADAYSIIDEVAQESFERYELTTNGNSIKLVYHQTEEVTEDGWDGVVEQSKEFTEVTMERIDDNITFTFAIGDLDKNEYYLTIVDGEVVYDIMGEFDNEEETEEVETVEVTLGMSEALEQGRIYVEYGSMSRNKLYDWLIRDGFTEEEVQYAVDEIFGK